VSGQVFTLAPGSQLLFDGDVVEVLELQGTRVTLRNQRTDTMLTVGLTRLVAAARSVVDPPDEGTSVGVTLARLTVEQRREIQVRAGHVRELLTGFRSGRAELAGPGEPDPRFAVEVALKDRYATKAAELGVTVRTLERWVSAYREAGEAGLAAQRVGAPTVVDPRWDEAVRSVLAGLVRASTPTRSAVIARVSAQLAEQYGLGVVPLPSQATAYRRLAELTKGTNAVSGSAKGRRSIAERPSGAYGRLRATRPGEYLILDTQDLDVFAMEPVTCRWVRVQLTVAQDLFTRCIVGMRVTPVSTKAVDVAGVLFEAVAGREAPQSWPPDAVWPYHGVPSQLVFDETVPAAGPLNGRDLHPRLLTTLCSHRIVPSCKDHPSHRWTTPRSYTRLFTEPPEGPSDTSLCIGKLCLARLSPTQAREVDQLAKQRFIDPLKTSAYRTCRRRHDPGSQRDLVGARLANSQDRGSRRRGWHVDILGRCRLPAPRQV